MIPPARLLLTLALALVAAGSSTGCGMMRLRGGDVERVSGWPLAERITSGVDPSGELQFSGRGNLPSCLVRISLERVAQDLAQEQEPKLKVQLYRSVFHSGLFSSVTYQYDADRYSIDTDYTLDMTFFSEPQTDWYSYAGAFTLGALPFWDHTNYTLQCVVRDTDHKVLGTVERKDSLTDVHWLPFVPINMLFDLLDVLQLGTLFGLNEKSWVEKEKALVETLFRSTLTEVRDVILEAVRKKRAAEKKASEEETPETPSGGDPKKEPKDEPDTGE